jgi:hypothetical protein
MGGGESVYVQDQEKFVRANIDRYKAVLPNRLSRNQIAGKLRQLYANSDTCRDNRDSYILSHDWVEAKKKITPIYANIREQRGERRYRHY